MGRGGLGGGMRAADVALLLETHTHTCTPSEPPCKPHPFPRSYYSYKWAEVLSADAFAAFEEAGLEDEAAVAATGRRFADTVLGLGGGRAPQLVFADFRWAGGWVGGWGVAAAGKGHAQ